MRDTLRTWKAKELEFKVIKLDQKRNNVVVSRRAVIESENSAERDQLLENLQEGMEVKGIAKNSLATVHSLIWAALTACCTSLTWHGNALSIRAKSSTWATKSLLKVLKFDRERTRVSLGLKQLGEDPWVAIAKRYPEGTKLTGRVTNLTDYGCFVEIEEGVEGPGTRFRNGLDQQKHPPVQSC